MKCLSAFSIMRMANTRMITVYLILNATKKNVDVNSYNKINEIEINEIYKTIEYNYYKK